MSSKPIIKSVLFLILLGWASVSVSAAPDAGQILRDTQESQPLKKPAEPLLIEPGQSRSSSVVPESSQVKVNVARFTFTGNSAFSSEALREVVKASENKALNFGELMKVVESVEAFYKQAGYFLAQAYLPPQQIKDGEIEITISEGRLGQARLEGESRIRPEIIFGYLDQLPKGQALKLSEIERQILLINDLSGSRASLDLQASDLPNSTDIVLDQKIDSLVSGRVDLNNYGMVSTGEMRLGVVMSINSPLHLGDRLLGNILRSENGNLISYGLNYELPVGYQGWRVNAGTSRSEYSLGGAFSSLNATGTVISYRAGVAYPLIRSRNRNVNLKLDVAHNDLEDHSLIPGANTDKSSNAVYLTASTDWVDSWMTGGRNRVDLSLTRGRLTLDSVTSDPNNTSGAYTKWVATLQREQAIKQNLALLFLLTHQQAFDNLDSSEKFSVGGPATMPGYASGERSSDSGTLAKVKLNWRVRDNIALGAFVDYAHVSLLHNPGLSSGNHQHFSDAGFSLDWLGPHGLTATVITAWAIDQPPNPSDNDRPRLWANMSYNW